MLAPSNRAADLREGRRALQSGELGDVVAIGPALPVSRRSTMAAPVGVRANLALALAHGAFDVVHGFEPGLPSLSYLALRDTKALAVATFFSPDRVFYPPGKAQRARLLGRIDALLATSEETANAAAERFPGDYTVISPGVDRKLFHAPRRKRRIVVELVPGERDVARAAIRRLDDLDGWEVVLFGRAPLPAVRTCRSACAAASTSGRSHRGGARGLILNGPSEFVPAARRQRAARSRSGGGSAGTVDPRDDFDRRRGRARHGSTAASPAGGGRSTSIATRSPIATGSPSTSTRTRRGRTTAASPPRSCSTRPRRSGSAQSPSPTTTSSGARWRRPSSRAGRDLIVIPGEEVKTKGQGEVIGLFLREEIPRGLSFEDTIAAIREQGGLVYLPHPFDRRHAIPDPATLHRHLAEIDVLEVYNARLLKETYNDEALRFARKYNLLQGAGSDAHVLPGLGTGAVQMREFRTPEEFLISLRTAEILRRPKSLAYLQSLKWVAQVKEKVR